MNDIPQIKDYLKDSIKNEFEIIFNQGKITYDNFVNILSVLKNKSEYSYLLDNFNDWRDVKITNELDISVHPSEDAKSLNLRWTLKNEKDIQIYCKTNSLTGLDYDLIYKKTIKKPIIDGDYNLKYNLKTESVFNKETEQFENDKQDIAEEIAQQYKTFQSLMLHNKNNFKNLFKTYRLKNRYSFTDKFGIHSLDLTIVRTSKKKISNPNQSLPVKKFIESNIFNESKTYEIELELNKNIISTDRDVLKKYLDEIIPDNPISLDKINNDNFIEAIQDKVIESIVNCTEFINSAINHYPFILSVSESEGVLTYYKQLIDEKKKEMIERKLDIISKLRKDDVDEETLTPSEQKFISTLNMSKLTFIAEKYVNFKTKRFKTTNYFIGPKPISMEMEHLQPKNENYILKIPYCVTDKADGIGKLLFICKSDLSADWNELYLIDSNLKIYKTGMKCYQFNNCLFNCEFIKHKNLIMIYDTYFIDKPSEPDTTRDSYKDVFYRNLFENVNHGGNIQEYTRIEMAQHFIDTSKLGYIDISNPVQMQVHVKTFLDVSTDFSKSCKEIWNKRSENIYSYDGLIFTPSELPVAFDNTPDFDLYSHTRWDFNIKWKPPHENTIDFLIKESSDDIITKIVKTGGTTNIKKFKPYDLYVGQNVKNSDPCELQLKNYTKNNIYIPSLFNPNQPYLENIHKAYLEIEPKSKKTLCKYWEEYTDTWLNTKNMIDNNTIVEFAYNIHSTDEIGFKWIPVKLRNDKTVSYQNGISEQINIFKIIQQICKEDSKVDAKLFNIVRPYLVKNYKLRGISIDNFNSHKNYIQYYYKEPLSVKVSTNYGNDFNTANNVWKTINNPVTTEILLNVPDLVPSELDNDTKYFTKQLNYSRDKSLTLSLQEFHNKIIKSKILLQNSVIICKRLFEDDTRLKNISLLDYATGKGGDLFKWKLSGINKVIGVDNVRDNIFNEKDGACIRRNNLFNRSTKPKDFMVYFLQGDVSKNISSGEAFESTSMRLYKERWTENELYKENKFNIVSMMFAIHYMFTDETVLDKLIQNIDENLKPGGLFIGACLDGKKTFQYLSNTKKNEYKTGKSPGGEKLWSIKKKYDNSSFNDDNTSLNYCISIKMYSINTEIDEYLVNFEFLKKKLAEKNIFLIDNSELYYSNNSSDTLDNVFSQLESTSFDVGDQSLSIIKNMSDDEKIISFLTRYFIFKKMIT